MGVLVVARGEREEKSFYSVPLSLMYLQTIRIGSGLFTLLSSWLNAYSEFLRNFCWILVFVFTTNISGIAQNLVPNPGFETFTSVPTLNG